MDFAELKRLYDQPLFELISQSRAVHLQHWRGEHVQRCSLLSIKTGGCSEDCAYCERVLETIREVSQLGIEVCVTLGQIGPSEARKLREAGVTAYNHNIDTSPEFYPEIVTTHTFADRLNTIAAVQESGMSVCCGGIVGMGESTDDRLRMLEVLNNFNLAPESVPINCLMAMPGTPLETQEPIDVFDLVRLIAVTRLALPQARVRLAAGRTRLSREGQALCFFAGANSIFYGDKLLTAENPAADADVTLLRQLGLAIEPNESVTEERVGD